MTSAFARLKRLQQNDPPMTDLDIWINGDVEFQEELTVALQANTTIQSVSILYSTSSNVSQNPAEEQERQLAEDDCLMSLLKALGSVPTLRKICLTGPTSPNNPFPIKVLAALLQNSQYCTRLSVGRLVTTGTEADVDHLADILSRHNCLEELFLNGSILFGGTQGVPDGQNKILLAISAIKSLKTVTLNGIMSSPRNLSLASVSRLCKSPTLTKLLIYDFGLTDDHLENIAQASEENHNCQLREIRLSQCNIGSRGFMALAKLVETSGSRALQLLHVWIKEIDFVTTDQAESTTCCLRLAEALQKSRLRDFRLLAGTQYQQRLMASTDTNNADQERHPIATPNVQDAFCRAIQYNYHLETFSIPCCEQSHQIQIAFFLKLNKIGRRQLFGDRRKEVLRTHQHRAKRSKCDAPYNRKSEWVHVLNQATQDLSCLCYFLSMNPSLCLSS